ncbi:MAG: DUF1552 domain-containing protein [Polyangiaceae bacterium]
MKRRALLRALAALALPFGGANRSAKADASPSTLQRYIGIFMPHGIAREHYLPADGFSIADDSVLTPFVEAGLAAQLLLVEGLDLTAGLLGGSSAHEGSRVLLTGSARDGRNASLDQYLATERGFGALTPLSSLVLGVGNADTSTANSISYTRGGASLPKIIDPSQTFREAFGRWAIGDDPAELERSERERRRGKSVLDTLRSDLQDLRQQADSASSALLDQHVESLRALELKLGRFELACSLPPAPDSARFPRLSQGGQRDFDAIIDLQLDLLAAAFACGVTRFATLYLPDLSYTHLDASLPDDIHEGVAHRYRPSDADSSLQLAKQNRYLCSKLARLGRALADGGLLDTTLIHASSDMGDPAKHSSRSIPSILLGGGGAGLALGRVLDASSNGVNLPNNRLLVSIARSFGVELDRFGDFPETDVVTGALSLG